MAQKVVFITTTGAGTFTVPSDFGSLVSVEAIGGGVPLLLIFWFNNRIIHAI
jgi:hypothetical protein